MIPKTNIVVYVLGAACIRGGLMLEGGLFRPEFAAACIRGRLIIEGSYKI